MKNHHASLHQRIKVLLDNRTSVVINKLESLAIWKKKYPDAKIIYNHIIKPSS
ncbi:MAG TPA: hypothetical protein VJY62_22570 [Bacteroidia bacterium]|nr:hypothetical protein [Bacteroidia bacterium]